MSHINRTKLQTLFRFSEYFAQKLNFPISGQKKTLELNKTRVLKYNFHIIV